MIGALLAGRQGGEDPRAALARQTVSKQEQRRQGSDSGQQQTPGGQGQFVQRRDRGAPPRARAGL